MENSQLSVKINCYKNLQDDQLLASFISEESAKGLLDRYGNLKEVLMYCYPEELEQVPGIGKVKAKQLKTIAELAYRLYHQPQSKMVTIRSPKDVFDLMESMQYLRIEQFAALYLNTKNRVMETKVITQGTVNATVITPREVFHPAVKLLSTSVVLVHNHPSGDPTPSHEDKVATERIVKAGEAIGIDVLDHIIIGSNQFVSLKEKGWM
jgi:DNA repair protein RadC